jgi:hypothetical protein
LKTDFSKLKRYILKENISVPPELQKDMYNYEEFLKLIYFHIEIQTALEQPKQIDYWFASEVSIIINVVRVMILKIKRLSAISEHTKKF